MKHIALFGGVLVASTLASTLVHAQSNVTFYGRIDNGIEYQTGLPNGSRWAAQSGDHGQSWFGMQGSEDLGGGTAAIFQLETGLNTQNGNFGNGSLFGRHATIGLTNPAWGTFKTGNLGAGELSEDSFLVDPQQMQKYAISTLVRGRNWSQTGNGFEYTSPRMGGLTIKGQYDLGNGTSWNTGNSGPTQLGSPPPGQPGSRQGRSDGLEVTYSLPGVDLIALYDEIRDGNGKFSNVYLASRNFLAGGVFTFGAVKVYAGYQHLSAPDASNAGVYGTAGVPTTLPAGTSLPTAVDHEWLGAAWQVTPAASLIAAVYHANANNGNGNATLSTVSATYNLSKRTFLYSAIGYLYNSSTSNIGLGNGYADPYGANLNDDPTTGKVGSFSPNYGQSQTGVFAGLMTAF
jgi:predicted porin